MLAAVAAGGVLGAEARLGVSRALPTQPGRVPWGTLLVNVVGGLLIGVLMVVVLELTSPHRLVRPFLGVGILGGFTTFSTFSVDAVLLADDGHRLLAAGYVVATPVLAITATWVGMSAVRSLVRLRSQRAPARGGAAHAAAGRRPGRLPTTPEEGPLP